MRRLRAEVVAAVVLGVVGAATPYVLAALTTGTISERSDLTAFALDGALFGAAAGAALAAAIRAVRDRFPHATSLLLGVVGGIALGGGVFLLFVVPNARWGAYQAEVADATYVTILAAVVGSVFGVWILPLLWRAVRAIGGAIAHQLAVTRMPSGGRWASFAATLGLSLEVRRSMPLKAMVGVVHGLATEIEVPKPGTVRIKVDAGARGVEFTRRSPAAVRGTFATEATGDEAFDLVAESGGVEIATLSVANARIRAAIVDAFVEAGEWRVEDGVVVREIAHDATSAEILQELRKPVLTVARLLAEGNASPREENLAAIATADPSETMRLRALRALVTRWPHEAATAGALDAAASDPRAEVRLFSCRARNDAPGLEALVVDVGVPVDLRCQAYDAALRIGAEVSNVALSRRAVADAAPELRVAVANGAARERLVPMAGALAELLSAPEDEVRRAAAAFFAAGVCPDLPAAVVDRLDLEADRVDRETIVLLVRAAGISGGADAVEPLQRVAHRLGGEVRRAAENAVQQIQARLVGAEAGQVTLANADPAAGAVTLADDARGRVAVATQKKSV